jgi:hypothetical protein
VSLTKTRGPPLVARTLLICSDQVMDWERTTSGAARWRRITSFSNALRPADPSGEWNENDYDVLADGVVVGRLFKVNAAPVGMPWMWTLEIEHCGDRTATHGYAETREAAMAAFAKRWRRE